MSTDCRLNFPHAGQFFLRCTRTTAVSHGILLRTFPHRFRRLVLLSCHAQQRTRIDETGYAGLRSARRSASVLVRASPVLSFDRRPFEHPYLSSTDGRLPERVNPPWNTLG